MVKLGEVSVSVNYIEMKTFFPLSSIHSPRNVFPAVHTHETCQTLCQALRLVETDPLIILTGKKINLPQGT